MIEGEFNKHIAKHINQINKKILFLDIETVSCHHHFDELSEGMQKMWVKKSKRLDEEITPKEQYTSSAGIYSEFAKVACVSIGFVYLNVDNEPCIKVKSLFGEDEKKILEALSQYLDQFQYLCAHNGLEFDFPFLGRRYVINQVPLPDILDVRGKKTWETTFIDTMQLWKFGDWKNYVSLELLCHLFDIKTPKDDIDGSQVGRVYWEDNDHDRIAKYCEKDVISTIQVYLKYCMMPIIVDENIETLERKIII